MARKKLVQKVNFIEGYKGKTWGSRDFPGKGYDFLGGLAVDLTKKNALIIADRYRARGYLARVIERKYGWKVVRSSQKATYYKLGWLI